MLPDKILPSILKNINATVIVVKPDLKIKYVSGNFEKLLKYLQQDIIGKKLDRFLKDKSLSPSSLFDNIKNSSPDNGELEGVILDSQNNQIPVSITVKNISGKTGKITGYIFIITDISETENSHPIPEEEKQEIKQKKENLKKLQKELEIEKNLIEEKSKERADKFKEEHAKLLAAINDLNLCFLITDKYGNIILNNKIAPVIFPFLDKEKKITLAELQKSSQINLDLNILIKKLITDKKCETFTGVQIDSKFIDIYISPIIIESQENTDVLGAALIIEDQTKKHELERSKEDLFNIASHELRTPLTAIYGYTSLIKQIYFGNIQNEELKMIINNIGILSKKLSLSVSNFLDSSKLEQGRIELKIEPCNLFVLINESIKEMESLALWKNLYIKFDPPPTPIIINADRIRITQILNILINNAIKFTHTGGIYISIETESNYAKIIIKDTGTGISDENKKFLFQKFQHSGDNLLTREEGSGLGLYVTKLLVQKMGGAITLEKTELNKGTTFAFTIPALNT